MNFLAHIYLSGSNENIIVGNFMGDYVKGKEYLKYPEEIRKGILLHREIDYYTDTHPVVRQSKKRIESYYRKYAGIVIDIFYDYFLSSNWAEYNSSSLPDFTNGIHAVLSRNREIFPTNMRDWFPNFLKDKWLVSYSSIDGIEDVLHRMSCRTSLPDYTGYAIEVLREEEQELHEEFNEFFPCIRAHVEAKFGIKTGYPFPAA